MTKAVGYRPDVDGLRAVAILPVLLFHAGLDSFSGGYVGVDIFFVISGFLITSIIVREMDEGHFSLLGFYERRARRILPALIFVVVAVLAAATLLYLPEDLDSVSRSALAAILFLSNVGFFLDTGYFQGGAETKPLLHTWSLAVEEQFYIGLPILLLLIARWLPARRIAVVTAAAILSFAMAVLTQDDGSGFAFYLSPPRAWELLLGVLLALGAVPPVRSRPVREAAAAAGLAAIGYAVATFDRHTTFPGVNALFPVLGAAALIHCAPGTLAGRLLAWRPMVGIGLISYSLYLWHWPLIVFTEYATGTPLAGWTRAFVLAGSVGIAVLSWRYVEAPFRQRTRMGRRAVFAASGSAMAATCAAAAALVSTGGWPARFPAEVVRLAAATADVSPYRDRCHDSDTKGGRPPCILGAPAAPPSAMLWGDSHGVELAYALSDVEASGGRALVQRTHSSCPPVLDFDPSWNPRCARLNQDVMASIEANPDLRTIYLAAFWASDAYASPEFGRALEHTLDRLLAKGRTVVLIGPVPPHDFHVPRRLARLARFRRIDEAGVAERRQMKAADRIGAMAERRRGAALIYVDPSDILCDARSCEIIRNGAPLYFDSHHLSVAGATLVVAAVRARQAGALAARE
ncbi:acyltransferase family protein [Sphingosinicella sp. CPCC 101087]|uniref:acyltransferase family protein n=1 Tax=Sphingosinicella sp. CPCC 101087 TaxID=2497754 RepID=UPI00101DA941|nr:acyltransferase family protein [Sphingosinicella sp. CPCC 101087]